MSVDPLRPLKPGDPVKPGVGPLSARAWNALVEAARRARNRGDLDAGDAPDSVDPAATVLVRPAGALVAFSAQGRGDPIVPPAGDAARPRYAHQDQPAYDCAEPAGECSAFVVTIEPTPGGRLVRAVAAGEAVCRLSVSDDTHTRAKPVAGQSYLASSSDGGVPILWKEAGTGDLYGVVLVGDPCPNGSDLVPLSIVTNVCPTFTTDSGGTTLTGITVERRVINVPRGWLATDPSCQDNPDDCCGGGGGGDPPVTGCACECCDDPGIPRSLFLTIEAVDGDDCPNWTGTYPLPYWPAAGFWKTASIFRDSLTFGFFEFFCSDSDWRLVAVGSHICAPSPVMDVLSCSPFLAVGTRDWADLGAVCGCPEGTLQLRYTVSETDPGSDPPGGSGCCDSEMTDSRAVRLTSFGGDVTATIDATWSTGTDSIGGPLAFPGSPDDPAYYVDVRCISDVMHLYIWEVGNEGNPTPDFDYPSPGDECNYCSGGYAQFCWDTAELGNVILFTTS